MEFQKIFPNCIILTIDVDALKVNNYPFKCFRISEKIMEKFEEEEIEENIYFENLILPKNFINKCLKN